MSYIEKDLFLACIVIVSLSAACSKENAVQPQSPKSNTPAKEPVVVGTSASCGKPPKQLELPGKSYHLKSENAKGEPVMTLAYIKCENGQFALGDAEDSFTIHYAGDPSKNNGDIFLIGNWGETGSWSQALYSLDEKPLTSSNVTPTPTQTTSSSSTDSNSIVYTNSQYGFQYSLPERWKGYSIINSKWEGLAMDGESSEKVVETGPLISIRDSQWTAKTPRQDIPIMVFTFSQWNSLQQGVFHIGTAPIGPIELGQNDTYVFALPARYNYSFPPGYEEVDKIIESKPLKALELK